jgi:hypothetical protein
MTNRTAMKTTDDLAHPRNALCRGDGASRIVMSLVLLIVFAPSSATTGTTSNLSLTVRSMV